MVLLWSPRSDACVQLVDTFAGLAAQDNGKWALATVNVDAAPRVAQIFGVRRCRPSWRWPPVSRYRVSRACSRPSSCAAGSTRCSTATAGKLERSAGSGEAEEVDPELARGPPAAGRRRLRGRADVVSGDPGRRTQPRRSQGRDPADRIPHARNRATPGCGRRRRRRARRHRSRLRRRRRADPQSGCRRALSTV